jgi:hypothetical protein
MDLMATTKDLSELIDREMGRGQGPFLIRICQDAGLLPKAKRGGWRSMEQLTAEQLAGFVIAVAGTRAAGARNANGARAAVERFSDLTCDWGEGLGVHTLREDIANFLCEYRDKLEIGKGFRFSWILFISDEHCPEVEIRLIPSETDQPSRSLIYFILKTEEEESSVREAVVIGSGLLFELGVMLREAAAEDTTE